MLRRAALVFVGLTTLAALTAFAGGELSSIGAGALLHPTRTRAVGPVPRTSLRPDVWRDIEAWIDQTVPSRLPSHS